MRTNHRGRVLLEAFATLELEIANTGTRPTYSKGGKSFIVDLTFVNPRLMEDGHTLFPGESSGTRDIGGESPQPQARYSNSLRCLNVRKGQPPWETTSLLVE